MAKRKPTVKTWSMKAHEADITAMEYLKERIGLNSRAAAVRYALLYAARHAQIETHEEH
jgi:hypothetical protein